METSSGPLAFRQAAVESAVRPASLADRPPLVSVLGGASATSLPVALTVWRAATRALRSGTRTGTALLAHLTLPGNGGVNCPLDKRGSKPLIVFCTRNEKGTVVIKKAGFNCEPSTSGLRAGWCFGNLNDGGNDGVACRNSNNSVGNANWNGSLGATGYERNVYPKIIAPQHPRLCAKIA